MKQSSIGGLDFKKKMCISDPKSINTHSVVQPLNFFKKIALAFWIITCVVIIFLIGTLITGEGM